MTICKSGAPVTPPVGKYAWHVNLPNLTLTIGFLLMLLLRHAHGRFSAYENLQILVPWLPAESFSPIATRTLTLEYFGGLKPDKATVQPVPMLMSSGLSLHQRLSGSCEYNSSSFHIQTVIS